ncbi:MAG: DNA glycosylase [Candidatus Bathyarchaeota archaeon]|nr:DNA glycosylase [Candidatus Bathyarchaeota archaeon]
MKIWLNPSCPFDLDVTLCCGQVFRWDKHGEWWYGVVEGKVLKLRQIGNELEFENADVDFVKNYFGLNDDLPYIFSKISKDEHMKQAVEIFKGLRIIRQNPWECLVSYICATYKNISAIKQILFNLSKKFGEEIRFEGQKFYTFPTLERLAKAATQELAHCGLGYRVNYVAETAKLVHKNHFDFESLRKMSYEEAKNELLKFKGVGLKVADCVLLFALGKLEAFPVDVWIKRVILKYYANHFPKEFVRKISGKKSLSKTEYKELNLFGRKYFGEYAGYAQEYLYHYERTRV